MLNPDLLWLAYKNTRFKWQAEPLTAQAFTIMTAYNPRSVLCSESDNEARQSRLLAAIHASGWRCATLIAGDKGFEYFEPSLAVTCCLKDAADLAKKFEQNAIYHVQDDQLSLVPVLLLNRDQEHIGRFSQRLIG